MAYLCRSDTLVGSPNGYLTAFACSMNSSGAHGIPKCKTGSFAHPCDTSLRHIPIFFKDARACWNAAC